MKVFDWVKQKLVRKVVSAGQLEKAKEFAADAVLYAEGQEFFAPNSKLDNSIKKALALKFLDEALKALKIDLPDPIKDLFIEAALVYKKRTNVDPPEEGVQL